MSEDHTHEDREQLAEEMMSRFREYLNKKRLKSTRQRDTIAEVFFRASGHISIEELLVLSRRENAKIGYATVYRTLKLLTESGLAAIRRFGNDSTTYEIAGDTAHHDHLICAECNHVIEFENDEIEKLQDKVAEGFGFALTRHRLELYGLCEKARGIDGGTCPREECEARLDPNTP